MDKLTRNNPHQLVIERFESTHVRLNLPRGADQWQKVPAYTGPDVDV